MGPAAQRMLAQGAPGSPQAATANGQRPGQASPHPPDPLSVPGHAMQRKQVGKPPLASEILGGLNGMKGSTAESKVADVMVRRSTTHRTPVTAKAATARNAQSVGCVQCLKSAPDMFPAEPTLQKGIEPKPRTAGIAPRRSSTAQMTSNATSTRKRTNTVQKKYIIELRKRPVQGMLGMIATHEFLVKLDQEGNLIDSLSFDPSESDGLTDNDPYNKSRGSTLVSETATDDDWRQLREAYVSFARRQYNVNNHNCTHAVENALNATNMKEYTKTVNIIFDMANRRPTEAYTAKKDK